VIVIDSTNINKHNNQLSS